MKIVEKLALDDVEPGMQIALPVVDPAGQVLIAAGSEVTESILHALSRRGIAELDVEREVAEDPAAVAAHRERLIAELDRRFRKAGDEPATRILYRTLRDYLVEHCQ